MLFVTVRVGQDKKGYKLNQRTKDIVKSFIKELAELQEKYRIEIDAPDIVLHEVNGQTLGYLEYNYDTIDVTLDDEVIASTNINFK